MHRSNASVLRVQGTSMRPFLMAGDDVLINPCSINQIRLGDIIAAKLWDGYKQTDKICVHRLVWKKVQDKYINIIIKGDSVSSFGRIRLGRDGECLGKVVGIARGEKMISLKNRWANLMELLVSLCLIPWQMMRGH